MTGSFAPAQNGHLTLQQIVDDLPDNFEIEERPEGLRITEHWFRFEHAMGLLLVAIVGYMATTQINFLDSIGPDKIPAWAAIAMVAGVACITYWGIAGCLNTTKLIITDETFSREVGPLPWFGSFEVGRNEVDQFFVKRHKTNVRRHGLCDWRGDHTTQGRGGFSLKYTKTVSRYRLAVAFTNGRRRGVSNKYELPYVPRMVEVLVEAALGIRDRFVEGEVRDM